MFAEDDTFHLLNIEFWLGEGEREGNASYVLSIDEYFLSSSNFFILKVSILAVGGELEDGCVGDVVLNVIFFEAGDGKLESDDGVCELTVPDVDFIQLQFFYLPMLLKPLAYIDVILRVRQLYYLSTYYKG